MIPIVLTIIAGYVAIGIAVVAALNYGMVERKSRLGSIARGYTVSVSVACRGANRMGIAY
jgi:hypothetical protein